MIQPKNETQDLLRSTTKKCKTYNKKNYTKTQKRLEFKLTKPREIFSFKPLISIE